MGERELCKLQVVGSIPIASTSLGDGQSWRKAGLGGRRGELGLVNLVWAPVGADKCGIFDIVDRFCR